MRLFGNRDKTDPRATTTAETPAEAADREAYEAERVEARERDAVADRPLRRDVDRPAYDDDRQAYADGDRRAYADDRAAVHADADRAAYRGRTVDDDAVATTRTAPAVHPIAATRDRFGGIDVPASLVGMLTALALLVLLGGLVGAAIGAIGYQTGLDGDEVADISVASLIGGLVILFVSYLVGGWAAGRIARYDGTRNGLMTGIWTLILAAALAALGAWVGDEYNVLANVDLPNWFNEDAVTTAAIISGAIAIATMLIAGALGGMWGTRYHRLADETLLDANEYRDVEVR